MSLVLTSLCDNLGTANHARLVFARHCVRPVRTCIFKFFFPFAGCLANDPTSCSFQNHKARRAFVDVG